MSSPATSANSAREPYRLALEPDGRSWTARENLVDVLHREILGPADGADELIEVAPDVRYLIGRIAPVRLTADADQTGEANASELDADETAASEGRGVPAVGEAQNGPDGDEDTATSHGIDDEPQKRGLMIPASMGLRFQVPLDLDRVTITASWGAYRTEKTEKTTTTGRPVSAYRRMDVSVPVDLDLAGLKVGVTASYPLIDDVVLRVDSRDDPDQGRRLVEVALCNDRETPRRIPVDAWMFQTRLTANAEGRAVFLPVSDVLSDDWFEPDDELRRLNLQYRNRLEFAVGRTCSADWTVAQDARLATEVATTWLPTSDTPQTRAVEIPDVLLDMRRPGEGRCS